MRACYQTEAITTLRHAVVAEKLIWVFCRWCGNARRLDPQDLVHRLGRDMAFDDLGRRMRCDRCTRKGVAAIMPAIHSRASR